MFGWSPVAPDHSALHYDIITSNCGSCPNTTTNTITTCTDVPTHGSVCTLAIQTVVCGNIIGDPVNFTVIPNSDVTMLQKGEYVCLVKHTLRMKVSKHAKKKKKKKSPKIK